MKKLTVIITLLVFGVNTFSQTISLDLQKKKPVTKTVIIHNNQAELQYQIVDCNDPDNGLYAEYAFLTASNKTNHSIQISYDLQMFYNDICISCDGDSEHQRKITLQANETLTADCNVYSNNTLKIFSKWTQIENKRVLTKIVFENILITEIH